MDIAQRQLQQVILPQTLLHQPIGQTVADERIGHRVSNLVRIPTFIRHTRNLSLEILAAVTSGFIHTDFGDNKTTTMEGGYMSNASRNHSLSLSFLLAPRAGMILGLDRFALNTIVLTADKISVSHLGSS